MTKYSVDSNRNDSERSEDERSKGGTCELCGSEADYLHSASIEGASLEVCGDCAPSDDRKDESEGRDDSSENRTKDLINRHTPDTDDVMPDSSWAEEGVGYDRDSLPYLVKNYGKRVTEARLEEDLSQEELADSIGVGVNIIRVIEQGTASRNDVGGSAIEKLEEELDITLREDPDA